MRTKSNHVIVSVYQSVKDLSTNHANHTKAAEMLKRDGFKFHVVAGFYRGERELSFLLTADDIQAHNDNLAVAEQLRLLYNQETVLEVCNDGTAYLHCSNGRIDKLGTFTEVSQTEAFKNDSYTQEPVSDRYYVVV